MRFYVATPSLNQRSWLKRCVASIRDQVGEGVRIWHHIQDGCSTDGTAAWVDDQRTRAGGNEAVYRITCTSEPDAGMYDAINRAWDGSETSTDVLCYLNCDEQYLPGALDAVARTFEANPALDVVLASMVVVNGNSEYLCHRHPLIPWHGYADVECFSFSCATFMRRRVFTTGVGRFDTRWRMLGDKAWYVQMANAGLSFETIPAYTSVYVDHGANLNLSSAGMAERQAFAAALPHRLKRLRPAIRLHNRIRYLCRARCVPPPTSVSLYDQKADIRQESTIDHPTAFWYSRLRTSEQRRG